METSFSDANVVMLCCQGRSGSTLLLRLLNTIDGYKLEGETAGAIVELLRFYNRMRQAEKRWKSSVGHEHFEVAWKNQFDIEKILNGVYAMFYELFGDSDSRVVGFKEIRFAGMDCSYIEFAYILDSFKELFPNLKIVFLTRNMDELINSAWWQEDKKRSQAILRMKENYFKQYYQRKTKGNELWKYFVTYYDLCNKTPALIGLFDFLGEEFSEENYNLVMSKVTR
jgi:hypothetical protein